MTPARRDFREIWLDRVTKWGEIYLCEELVPTATGSLVRNNTFSDQHLSIRTLSIRTLSIQTLSIQTLSIRTCLAINQTFLPKHR